MQYEENQLFPSLQLPRIHIYRYITRINVEDMSTATTSTTVMKVTTYLELRDLKLKFSTVHIT